MFARYIVYIHYSCLEDNHEKVHVDSFMGLEEGVKNTYKQTFDAHLKQKNVSSYEMKVYRLNLEEETMTLVDIHENSNPIKKQRVLND